MSKVTRLIVLCPNGRRQTVNLTPNSSILQILEEVCQKQSVNPDDFDICHYNKPLDLSLPVRFANLSNNAQLELQPAKTSRKDCVVTIGLQLESGERITKDFVPSTSIWDVVEQCLNNKPDLCRPNGEPICIYMRQKLIGDALKETTLRGLGLTKGSAIIRLMYRNAEDLFNQAHISTPLSNHPKDISPIFPADKLSTDITGMECDPPINKSEDSRQSTKVSVVISDTPALAHVSSFIEEKSDILTEINQKIGEEVLENSLMKGTPERENEIVKSRLLTDQKMEMESLSMDEDQPEEEIGPIHYIGDRHAVLYSLNDITNFKKADLPDEFFQLTVDDVKYLMEEFKKSRNEMENQPLLTKELRNRQFLQKLGCFKQTVIRVYFPDKLVLQAVFEAQETIQDVCNFIRNFLEDKNFNFYLYTTPPKEKKDPTKTLIESMLIPAAVMYFGCDKQNQNYLLNTLRDKVSDPRAAAQAASKSRKNAICETEDISSEFSEMPNTLVETMEEDYRVPGPSFSQPSSSVQIGEKVPKWLKMSKK